MEGITASNAECFSSGQSYDDGEGTSACPENTVMNGIAFAHDCGQKYDWEETIQAHCYSNLPGDFQLTNVVKTAWEANTGVSPGGTGHMCPEGMFVTEVSFSHECGYAWSYERLVSLTCASPPNGYSLDGTPTTSNYQTKQVCNPTPAYQQCESDEVMIGIDFTHDNGKNYINDESFRIHCQKLSGTQLYCPSN